jgi:hypothetical protein
MLISVIPTKGEIVEAVRNIEIVEKVSTTVQGSTSTEWKATRIHKGQKLKVLGGFRLLDNDGSIFLQVRQGDAEYTFGKGFKGDPQIKMKANFFNGNFALSHKLKEGDITYKEGEEVVHRFSGLEF